MKITIDLKRVGLWILIMLILAIADGFLEEWSKGLFDLSYGIVGAFVWFSLLRTKQ